MQRKKIEKIGMVGQRESENWNLKFKYVRKRWVNLKERTRRVLSSLVHHSTRNYTMCWLISEMEVGIFSIFVQWLQTVVKNPEWTEAIYFKWKENSAYKSFIWHFVLDAIKRATLLFRNFTLIKGNGISWADLTNEIVLMWNSPLLKYYYNFMNRFLFHTVSLIFRMKF